VFSCKAEGLFDRVHNFVIFALLMEKAFCSFPVVRAGKGTPKIEMYHALIEKTTEKRAGGNRRDDTG